VRCRRGHLFTAIWIPGISFKAVRLGWNEAPALFRSEGTGRSSFRFASRSCPRTKRRLARRNADIRVP
jgi:hypothetical protein